MASKHSLNNTGVDLVEQFHAALAGQSSGKQPKNQIDDEDFVALMWRMTRALEKRAMNNPAILPQVVELEKRFREVTNVAVAYNALSYRIDPMRGASMAECATTLGITKASGGERAGIGIGKMIERVEAAGIVRFAERQREKQIIQAAADSTVVALADFRARRRAA